MFYVSQGRGSGCTVQQPSVECTARVCTTLHSTPSLAETIHITWTDQQWSGYKDSAPES